MIDILYLYTQSSVKGAESESASVTNTRPVFSTLVLSTTEDFNRISGIVLRRAARTSAEVWLVEVQDQSNTRRWGDARELSVSSSQ